MFETTEIVQSRGRSRGMGTGGSGTSTFRTTWWQQGRWSDNGLDTTQWRIYRYDLACKIKDLEQSPAWTKGLLHTRLLKPCRQNQWRGIWKKCTLKSQMNFPSRWASLHQERKLSHFHTHTPNIALYAPIKKGRSWKPQVMPCTLIQVMQDKEAIGRLHLDSVSNFNFDLSQAEVFMAEQVFLLFVWMRKRYYQADPHSFGIWSECWECSKLQAFFSKQNWLWRIRTALALWQRA